MQEVFAPGAEARGAVGHDAFALGGADLAAQVRLAGFAEFAVTAFGRAVEGKCEKRIRLAFWFEGVMGEWVWGERKRKGKGGGKKYLLECNDVIAWFYRCHALAD